LIIGWGSTQGAIRDSLSELPGYRFLQVSYLAPFPRDEVKQAIKRAEKVVLVENNATGLLGQLIAMETGHLIKDKILKFDGRPFAADELVDRIKKIS
jgi:2-oxoglutarate ferredoxin oxidoreductase subunit alpha